MPSKSIDRPFLRVISTPHGDLTGLFVSLVIVGILAFLLSGHARAQGAKSAVDCAIQSGPCTGNLAGGTTSFDITPKPVRAMQDLTFTVALFGLTPTADPFIDLGMPGMVMGPNRVLLRPVGNGTYRGTGVIVRCPSGRRTWKATVTIPGKGAVEFIFDVVY
jgi:hypothetical protein